jgi:hypothetical protein
MKKQKLKINIRINKDLENLPLGCETGVYEINTGIDVPQEMNYYWINYDKSQIKVKLIGYNIHQSINNRIIVLANVINEDNNEWLEVFAEDLFGTEQKAYDFYLKSKYNK